MPTPYIVRSGVGAQIKDDVQVFLVDGTAVLPFSGTIVITKATPIALSLPAPAAGDDGNIVKIVSTTAQAHVVTSGTVGFNAKGSSGTATLTAAKGNGCTLVAYNGNWYSLSAINCTFA